MRSDERRTGSAEGSPLPGEDIGGSEGEQWVLLTPATRGHARGIQRRDGAPGRGRNRRFVPQRFCKQYRLALPV